VYWKFLRPGAVSPFTGFRWEAGTWVTTDRVEACLRGVHACRDVDLPYWIAEELWRIDLAGPVERQAHKVVAQRARLLDRVGGWDHDRARQFGESCLRRLIRHAADELRDAGRADEANGLESCPLADVGDRAGALVESLSGGHGTHRAAKLCGYVVDGLEAIDAYPVAAVAYIAARAANQRSGPAGLDLYAAERHWQATWLTTNLDLGAES
jgi:hypothetical protein